MEANRVELTMTQIKWACENGNDWKVWLKKSSEIPEDKLWTEDAAEWRLSDMEDHLHTWRDYLVELITWIERGIGMYGENDDDHSIDKLLEEVCQGLKIIGSLQEEMEC